MRRPMARETSAETRGAFRVLRHRDFRLLWIGLVVSAVGTWMQIVAQGVLVLDISHGSAFALGAVALAQAAAFLVFALFGGAGADPVDTRRPLLVTQSLRLVFPALLGVLTVLHVVAVWMVVALAFLQGTALSFDQPSRAALVADLVPKDELLGAFSLQSIVFTGASTLGPALAGMLLAASGYAANFFANAVSYLAVLAALSAIHAPHADTPARAPPPRAIGEALGAVPADPALPSLLAVYGALLFFGPSSALLLPVMSTTALGGGSFRLGLLFSATGAGTVIGGLALASAGGRAPKGRIVIVSTLLWA